MVFVLAERKKPLLPCSERRARILLSRGRALVHRPHPFTIRLRDRTVEESVPQLMRWKLDPGAKQSGVALVREDGAENGTVVHLAQVDHRTDMHKRMAQRAGDRRRSANLRHRKPRCANRHPERSAACGQNARHGSRFCRPCHAAGHHDSRVWPGSRLAPSLRCQVDNLTSWVQRHRHLAPITAVALELVRFDLQAIEDPETARVEYQQGTLAGFGGREYLSLEFGHTCAYCDGLAGDPILNMDHVLPQPRGGTDRVSNLVLARRTCNEAKNDRTPVEWAEIPRGSARPLDHKRSERCRGAQGRAKTPLRDAAAVNSTRWALHGALGKTGLSVEVGSGGRTKWNGTRAGLPKPHALDAACVGASTPTTPRGTDVPTLVIKAAGRGRYQRTNPDRSGFPPGSLARHRGGEGFRGGDVVRADVPRVRGNRKWKTTGRHVGPVAIRTSGSFRVGSADHRSHRSCLAPQRGDGYAYSTQKGGSDASSPRLKPGATGVA